MPKSDRNSTFNRIFYLAANKRSLLSVLCSDEHRVRVDRYVLIASATEDLLLECDAVLRRQVTY